MAMDLTVLPGICAFPKGQSRKIVAPTATYTIALDDDIILATGASPFTATLPPAASAYDANTKTGKVYWIMNVDADDCTIEGDGAETINGAANVLLDVQYEWIEVVSNGTAWFAKL